MDESSVFLLRSQANSTLEDVISVMSYLCSWRKLNMVKSLPTKTEYSGRDFETLHRETVPLEIECSPNGTNAVPLILKQNKMILKVHVENSHETVEKLLDVAYILFLSYDSLYRDLDNHLQVLKTWKYLMLTEVETCQGDATDEQITKKEVTKLTLEGLHQGF
ncbi:hypothetical protein STEG23_008329 [Scotinomys teguina]